MLYSIYANLCGKVYLEEYTDYIKAYSRYSQLSYRLEKLSKNKLEISDLSHELSENLDKRCTSSLGFVHCEKFEGDL